MQHSSRVANIGVADGSSNSPLSTMHTSEPPSPVKALGKYKPDPVLVGTRVVSFSSCVGVDVGVRVVGKLVGVSDVGVGKSVVIVVDETDGLEEGDTLGDPVSVASVQVHVKLLGQLQSCKSASNRRPSGHL